MSHTQPHTEPIHVLPPVWRGPEIRAIPHAGEINWGMKVFGVDSLRLLSDGSGVKAGVVDTGCDNSHPLLTRVIAKDFTGSASGAADRNGHGTHCTGTVGAIDPRIGVAPRAFLYHGKGLSDNGSGGNELIDAMEWCLSEGCEILSCSWGGGSLSPQWERKFREWSESPSRPWLVFAGGNSGPNTPDADNPGRSLHLFNVAALGQDLRPAGFSSAGDKLDTSGPGVDIVSCRSGGGFTSMSGTSMATPFVAGAFCLYRGALKAAGKPIPTVYELRTLAQSRSTDTHTPGDDRRTGPGWITPLLLSLEMVPDPPPVGE